MIIILLLSASLGLLVFAGLQSLPRFSPRSAMVRRLGAAAEMLRPRPSGVLRPWAALRARRRRALTARTYLDLLSHLAIQTRAGVALPRAFACSWTVLTEPLKGEVAALAQDLQSLEFAEALERFSARCDTPEVRDFVQNVLTLADAGDGVAALLAAEESLALARAGQAARRRQRAAAPVMAAAAVLLTAGGVALYFLPMWLR